MSRTGRPSVGGGARGGDGKPAGRAEALAIEATGSMELTGQKSDVESPAVETARASGRLMGLIRRLTLEQWLAIDAEYREPETQTRGKAVGLMLLVAFLLTLQKYFGNRGVFTDYFAQDFRGFAYPKLLPHLYWSFACGVVYFVIPALYIWFVLKERIRDYGFRLKGTLSHAPLYFAMFMVVFPLVVLVSRTPSFLSKYPFYGQAGNSWAELLMWESAYGLQFLTLEFFFRGFMLFYLARFMGSYAVFAMVIPYTMIHFSKPLPETLGAILAGTALGTLALRTRSIFGGVCIHVAVAWSMDLLALYWEGQLSRLFR